MEEAAAVCAQLRTVRDYVRWGASLFHQEGLCFGHGTDNALDEAYGLVLHALGLPYDVPLVYLESTLTERERSTVYELLRRRVETRAPAPYLMREAHFAGLRFYIDERVLAPRSPIAELIEAQFAPFIEAERVHHVLDIGTGSGCIAIACAYAFPHARVDAAEVSKDAMEVAQHNVELHHLEGRVRVLASDVYDNLGRQRYELIVSNPPYVNRAEMESLPQEFRREPRQALAAGVDGLDVVRRILAGAPAYLAEGGILVVEVGSSEDAVRATYPDVPFLWLDFERGGHGVFLLHYPEVQRYAPVFLAAVPERS